MSARIILKRCLQLPALAVAAIPALLAGFGRLRPIYVFFAQGFALVPGAPGDLLRAAYYRLTLQRSSLDVVISFGTYFTNPGAEIDRNVSVGAYCVIGRVRIGERTQIASHVEIPSGRRQHARNADGSLSDTAGETVRIGAQCWIGAAAVILASVGDGSTVGGGAVVVKDVPPGSVVVGNPARPLSS